VWSIPVARAPVASASRSNKPPPQPTWEMILGSQCEGIEDRPPREVMHVLGAPYTSRARDPLGRRATRSVTQSSNRSSGCAARAPRCEILYPESQRTQRIGPRVSVHLTHRAMLRSPSQDRGIRHKSGVGCDRSTRARARSTARPRGASAPRPAPRLTSATAARPDIPFRAVRYRLREAQAPTGQHRTPRRVA
jgi:hypothetical protein